MEVTKLKVKNLTTVDLVELFLKSEDACKYAERFCDKVDAYGSCKTWSKKLDICLKNMLMIHQEMRAKLEQQGAFNVIDDKDYSAARDDNGEKVAKS